MQLKVKYSTWRPQKYALNFKWKYWICKVNLRERDYGYSILKHHISSMGKLEYTGTVQEKEYSTVYR